MSTLAPQLAVELADYGDPRDAAELVMLLDAYASDPMGGGEPLCQETRDAVVPGLAATPGAFSLIARLDGQAVGLANCFTGFSTLLAEHRGRGVGKALLQAVEDEARRRGGCKITLEVLSGNERAQALYLALGYGDYQLDPEAGHALFWQKKLA